MEITTITILLFLLVAAGAYICGSERANKRGDRNTETASKERMYSETKTNLAKAMSDLQVANERIFLLEKDLQTANSRIMALEKDLQTANEKEKKTEEDTEDSNGNETFGGRFARLQKEFGYDNEKL